MKNSQKHPSRTSMIKAIKEGKIPFKEHLKRCESCRNLFELLRAFQVTGQSPIQQPSESAIERYTAIPLLGAKREESRRQVGSVVFDSWSGQPALQIREIGPGFVRRLCLKAGDITLEIVAERQQQHWEFAARVYKGHRISSQWILEAGGKRMLPQSQGFYHWSSKGTPRTVRLITHTTHIDFEKLSWK